MREKVWTLILKTVDFPQTGLSTFKLSWNNLATRLPSEKSAIGKKTE